jgi:DNA-binding NarL/FixJ family response regulator
VVIRVVLADDQALVRAGFRALLERTDDLEVVGEAADGATVLDVVRDTVPDVVLMDVRMPALDGIEATRRIVADPRLAEVKVLVLTTFEVDEYVFAALRAGASGFLLKDVEPDDLRAAIRVVASGQALLSPSVTRRLITEFTTSTRAPKDDTPLKQLTDRERDVVALVAKGMTNEEIGTRLFISPLTAKTHVNRAMLKLGARDRAQLVVVAYETGLVGD